jgi:hypothetical protein
MTEEDEAFEDLAKRQGDWGMQGSRKHQIMRYAENVESKGTSMTNKEAMAMALEFIERVNKDGWILADFEPQMYQTITAIKDALAQPEQEPVAYLVLFEGAGKLLEFTKGNYLHGAKVDHIPLYTAPPQRTWLTDEDISALLDEPERDEPPPQRTEQGNEHD